MMTGNARWRAGTPVRIRTPGSALLPYWRRAYELA